MTLQSRTTQTNLVLLIPNNEVDMRKFIVWNIENTKPLEVLNNLQISRIAVEIQKKMFEHPLENGATIVDYEVLEPKKATIQAYISNEDNTTLTELERLYIEGTRLRVRAENRIMDNMVLASLPYEITGSMIDKTLYSIAFKQADFVMPQYVGMSKAKKKSNTSRVNSGIKQTSNVTNKKRSWLYSLIFGGRA